MSEGAPTEGGTSPKAVASTGRPPSWVRRWLPPFVALGLLVWVLDRHGGVSVITQLVERLGWSWLWLILPWATVATGTILAYRTALPDRGRAIPFLTLVQIERSGSALNALLPLGNHSSQIVKLTLLRHWFRSEQIVAAGLWCVMATALSNAYGGFGTVIPLVLGYGDRTVVALLTAVGFGMAVPWIFVVVMLPKGLATRVSSLITRVPIPLVRRFRDRAIRWATRLDRHVASAVGERRADFLRLMRLRLACQVIRILEIWLVVHLLGLPGGILTALLYNGVSRAVTQLAAFIPGRLGVMEAAQAAAFGAMGLTSEAGLALALTLRSRYIVNLVLSYGALARVNVLAARFPPRNFDVSTPTAHAPLAESRTPGSPAPETGVDLHAGLPASAAGDPLADPDRGRSLDHA